ncbi:zinc finger FYVE domain-containing protein 26-like isoform X2 [Acanthaster planci]|uniref:Zinc finger FYVE domain-containing protein 26-like isoform X2 n=1 Tax=Acanthaster planci TaxID=133434 RepID=A0A8B7YN79_ACAPL|nr:zinc finger FYVE domain-containing protein 26-like isoform X2 [Acanthaster planci]
MMATYTPTSTSTHPFGQEEKVSQQQLFVAFCNHLHLGQWELVRACGTTLLEKYGEGEWLEPSVRKVLEAVVEHPFDCSLASESVPSAHHLAWLALQEHRNLSSDVEERPPHSVSTLVEFRLLLHSASSYAPTDVVQDVYNLFIYIQDIKNAEQLGNPPLPTPHAPSLTDRIRVFLKAVVQRDPHLGHSLLGHLALPAGSRRHLSHNRGLQQVYVDCLMEDISALRQAPGNREKLVSRVYKVLSLMDPSKEMEDLQLELLFLNLLDLTKPPHQLLRMESLYSSLLGRGSAYLVRELCRIERLERIQELSTQLEVTHPKLDMLSQELRIMLRLARMEDRELAWKEMFCQALSRERHILANVLDTSMTFIRDGMYSELVTLLSPDEFVPLKPLVLLLGWNHVSSCNSANRLLQALHTPGTAPSVSEPLLDQACGKLTHQVQLVQWCLEKTRPFLLASGVDPGFDPKASEMFCELDSRSVLHMLHHATNLSQLESAEVFDILSKKPQLGVKPEESTKFSGKTVRFEEPQQLSIQQERDIAVYRSFLAIKSCMMALSNSTQCKKPKEKSNQDASKQGVSQSAGASLDTETSRSTGSTLSSPHQPLHAHEEAANDSTGSPRESLWEKNVWRHLREARHQLSLLYPLTYRVETLENIFSLLFTRSEDAFVARATMSDSGGEEGVVDEDWQKGSVTSLDSTPKCESFTFNLEADTLRDGPSASDSNLLSVAAAVQDELPTESMSTGVLESLRSSEKRERTSSGSAVAQRSNTERSSESHSQLSSNSLGAVKICFVAEEDITDALLSTLKECLADLSEARYSLAGPSASLEVLQEAGGRLMKYMHCSVLTSTMAQHISQLTQRVNEAWWRYRLVSQATSSQNATHGLASGCQPMADSSSDEELYMTGSHRDKDDKRGDKCHGKRSRSRVSSFSGRSGSDGSTSSSKRRKKRRRRKCQPVNKASNTGEHGVIARMLSSQDTLLRMCLHRGSYSQALQVVKMFELENTPEVSEVYFAEHWEQTLRRLQNLDTKAAKSDAMPSALKGQPSKSSSSIATIAASGTASLSVTGVVDDLLAKSVLPLFPTASLVGLDQPEKHSVAAAMLKSIRKLNVAGVVVFDLACSACTSWKASRDLLEVAMGRLQLGQHIPGEFDQSPRSRLQSGSKMDPLLLLVGVLPFVHQIASLIAPTSADSTALIRQDIMEEFFRRSARDALLQATKPLDAVGLRAQVNSVLEQRKAVTGLSRALQTEGNQRTPDPSGSQASGLLPSEMDRGLSPSHKGRSMVHQAMRQLLQTFDRNGNHCYSLTALLSTVGPDQDTEFSNYLMSLYGHVSVLSSLLVEAKEWYPGLDQPVPSGSMKAVNPYCVLEDSPNFLLGRLMFQNQIPPTRLEGVADQLKLNLVHVIIRSCCPTIPIHLKQDHQPPSPTSPSAKSSPCRIVLNNPGEGSKWPCDARHPEVVARDLLSRMIMLMKGHMTSINSNGKFGLRASVLASSSKDFRDLCEATRELAFVDLDRLDSPGEQLCFFTNVMNLMLAHASLHHVHQQLISKETTATTPSSGHTRHSSLTATPCLENVVTLPGTSSRLIIERIAYLNKMAYRIGQLGVVSAFELRYIILRPGLHPPSCFNHMLLHRLHALNVEDPWHRYLPPAETRLLFVISNGCQVSPALQVLQVNTVEEQLESAMQQFLENYVIVNEERMRVTIPKQLDWFRKDFTGKSLGTDVEQGHIYGGLLNVVAPHMSKQLGEKLERFVLSCQPGKIELEEKPASPGLPMRPKLTRTRSFKFTVRIEPYNFCYGYKFEYRFASKLKRPVLTHRRSSSEPEGLLSEVPVRHFECLPRPTFSMTESTLAYLHSKSKLVASLAGLVSMSVDDRPDRFALKKSFESSNSLTSSVGSPMSLVFDEGAFGEDREFLPDVITPRLEMTKMAQHVIGYSTVQRYVESFMLNIVETAETLQDKASSLNIPEGHPANTVALTMRNAHACTLANLSSDHYQAMVYYTVDHLITYSKWADALHLIYSLPKADALSDWLPQLSIIRDFVLCCAAQADLSTKKEELLMSDSWRALLCLQDKDLCSRVTLGLLPRLPVSVCLQLLEHCVANPAADTSLKESVAFKLEQMKTYSKIAEYAQANDSATTLDLDNSDPEAVTPPSPYVQWQRAAADSQEDPHAVLAVLLGAGDFELAKKWAVQHNVYLNLKETIHEKHLLHLLGDSNNTLMAYQILEQIGDRALCLRICRNLLDAQGDRISLASTVFLVQLMMDHFLDLMAMEQVEELQSLSLGAKALLCLPEPERHDCEHLVSKPMLMLEQLLMNTKIEHASTVLTCLRRELQSTHFPASELTQASCDALVTRYAKNAIQLIVAVHTPQSDFESTLRSVSALSMTSPSGQRRSRSRLSVSSIVTTLSPPSFSSSASQAIPVARDRAPSPTPSIRSVSKGLSPRGQSSQVATTPQKISVSAHVSGSSVESHTVSSVARPMKEATGLPDAPPKREDWVPDLKETHCMVCKEERFSMFNRRHHCRRCGRVVCWRCSQLKAVVEGYGDAPVRVCDQCYQTFIMPRPQNSNMSSLEQRLKAKQPDSRHSPAGRLSPGKRTPSPSSWQHRMPVAGSSFTSVQSGGADTLLMAGMEWQLTLDDVYNTLIREDFYYEQAPSTSVCLSILDLHSDHSTCGTLILQICRDLSEYLRPIRPGVPNPEVDYNLIISMMKTLLFNAKLHFIKDGDSSSIELCDSYRSFVDLLSLFVRSNCADIPSIQQLANADSARQVRDRLVLAERLQLAAEVSTKCGLDASAVWSAWGISCLRAGDYQGAREKFARILKPPSDKNVMSVTSKLLTDIIQYLETSASQADTAQAILSASVTSIRDFIAEPTSASFTGNPLDNPALQECHFYITTYCPHISMVQFYHQHNRLSLAVSYILHQHCSSEVFLEGLLVPCMKQGKLRDLQTEMLHQDPTLAAWNNYLTVMCRYLNAHSLAHVLYNVQLFMKDFVRASMTCIKFYQSGAKTYSDLFDRLHYLTKAKEHMKAVLDEKQWDSVPRPPMTSSIAKGSTPSWAPASDANIRLMMTPSQLTNHMNTISQQIEVTKLLHRMASSGKSSLLGSSQGAEPGRGEQLPTLFGNSKVKAEVAYRVLLAGPSVNDGFLMAFQIIQDFRLPDTLIYSHIGRRLAAQHKYKDIHQLLVCVRNTGLSNDQCCDEILDACVRVLASDSSQTKEVEGLIKLIKSDTNKINALMLCGKLKSAYLIAVKAERVEDVQRILSAAQRAGPSQAQMKTICESWLASQAEKRQREMKTKELLMRSKQERS